MKEIVPSKFNSVFQGRRSYTLILIIILVLYRPQPSIYSVDENSSSLHAFLTRFPGMRFLDALM